MYKKNYFYTKQDVVPGLSTFLLPFLDTYINKQTKRNRINKDSRAQLSVDESFEAKKKEMEKAKKKKCH